MAQHSVMLAISAQFIATQLLPMVQANQQSFQQSYNSPRSIYTNADQTSNTFDHIHTIDRQDQFDNFNPEDGVTAAIISVSYNQTTSWSDKKMLITSKINTLFLGGLECWFDTIHNLCLEQQSEQRKGQINGNLQ